MSRGRTGIIPVVADLEALSAQHAESDAAVQKIAEEGGVLLKNENGALPLNAEGDNTVAVIGVTGMSLASGIGGERSYGTVASMTSPYQALVDLLGEDKVVGEVYNDIIEQAENFKKYSD